MFSVFGFETCGITTSMFLDPLVLWLRTVIYPVFLVSRLPRISFITTNYFALINGGGFCLLIKESFELLSVLHLVKVFFPLVNVLSS
jgi:hypothetical protein